MLDPNIPVHLAKACWMLPSLFEAYGCRIHKDVFKPLGRKELDMIIKNRISWPPDPIEGRLLLLLFDELTIPVKLLTTAEASGWIHSPLIAGSGDAFGNRLSIIVHFKSHITYCCNVLIEIVCRIKGTMRKFLLLIGSCSSSGWTWWWEHLVFRAVCFYDDKPKSCPNLTPGMDSVLMKIAFYKLQLLHRFPSPCFTVTRLFSRWFVIAFRQCCAMMFWGWVF